MRERKLQRKAKTAQNHSILMHKHSSQISNDAINYLNIRVRFTTRSINGIFLVKGIIFVGEKKINKASSSYLRRRRTHLLIQSRGCRGMPGGRPGAAAACRSLCDESDWERSWQRRPAFLFAGVLAFLQGVSYLSITVTPQESRESGPSPFGHRL